jgi:hypothetical protein
MTGGAMCVYLIFVVAQKDCNRRRSLSLKLATETYVFHLNFIDKNVF